MRRLSVFVTYIFLGMCTWAMPVDTVALHRMAGQLLQRDVVDATPEWLEGCRLYIGAEGRGFVLLANDDRVRPLLAFSHQGHFPTTVAPQVRTWLEGYSREIATITAALKEPTVQVSREWQRLQNTKTGDTLDAPFMLTTMWNQSPYYNALCPTNPTDGATAVAGCVAIAMAQVMKYWNHPSTGWGSYAYNHQQYGRIEAHFDTTHYAWSLMPDILTGASSDGEIDAIARLVFHAGVAVRMDYGTQASGASVSSFGSSQYPSSENALRSHFKYSALLRSEFRSDHDEPSWDSLLVREVNASRPVLYAGEDPSGGHAFVLDGYDTLFGRHYFHFNWGWGGAHDGFYTLDSLAPGAGGIGGNASYTFNSNNLAIVGIEPAVAASNTAVVVCMITSDSSQGSVTGSGVYSPFVDNVEVMAHPAQGFRFSRWASGNRQNPLQFLAIGDMTDTALFEPLGRDTLAYCNNTHISSWQDDYGNLTEWGIRIPAALRNPSRSLSAVELFLYERGNYDINIYVGDSIIPTTFAHHLQTSVTNIAVQRGWTKVSLSHPLPLDDSSTLWITVRFRGQGFPAAFSRYTGCPDGTWYHLPEGWRRYSDYGIYTTWMVRALFEEQPSTERIPVYDEMDGLESRVLGNSLLVDNPMRRTVVIYDALGRRMHEPTRQTNISLPLPSAGIYLLQADGLPARRIVVTK